MMNGNTPTLIAPYGGTLINLLVPPDDLEERKAYASRLRSLQLSPRSVCDLELLAIGGFSPLDRFMGQADYQRVLDEMRLADGTLFPMPVTLPIPDNADIFVGETIALRNDKNELLAIMTVEEKYGWDMDEVSLKAFGTLDARHPIVAEMQRWGKFNIAGKLEVLATAHALRFHAAASDSRSGARSAGNLWASECGRFPDAQSAASRSRRTDQARDCRRSMACCCCIHRWA